MLLLRSETRVGLFNQERELERLGNKMLLWKHGILAEEKNTFGARKYSNEVGSKN